MTSLELSAVKTRGERRLLSMYSKQDMLLSLASFTAEAVDTIMSHLDGVIGRAIIYFSDKLPSDKHNRRLTLVDIEPYHNITEQSVHTR